MEEKKHEIVIDPKSGDVTEQLQKIINQNNAAQPMNRKQRRALEKQNKLRERKLQKYLERHPEAIKIELDEEAVKKVEEEEKNKANQLSMAEALKQSSIAGNNEEDVLVIDVPFTELAEEEK